MDNPFNLPEEKKIEHKALKPYKLEDTIIDSLPAGTELTEDQRRALTDYAASSRHGIMSFMPIICKADRCPYYNKCPLVKAKVKLPVGKDCPVEIGLQQMWFNEFQRASGIDANDPDTYVYDLLMLNDLASYQTLDARATMELAEDPQIVQKQFIGYDRDGNPLTTFSLNPIVAFKEKIAKIKMKYLQELIATRRAKSSDFKSQIKNDPSARAAELMLRAREIEEKDRKSAIEVDFEVKEQ